MKKKKFTKNDIELLRYFYLLGAMDGVISPYSKKPNFKERLKEYKKNTNR